MLEVELFGFDFSDELMIDRFSEQLKNDKSLETCFQEPTKFSRTRPGEAAFSYYAPYLLNKLPEELRSAQSVGAYQGWKHYCSL